MDTRERRTRWVVALGALTIVFLGVAVTVVLSVRYPTKPSDAGDGLGLVIGLVFWPVLLAWCIGGWYVLSRIRR
jgi:hypothetical protein